MAERPPTLELCTDGSAGGRAGPPGGWAFLTVLDDAVLVEGSQGATATTSVLLELEAVSAASQASKRPRRPEAARRLPVGNAAAGE